MMRRVQRKEERRRIHLLSPNEQRTGGSPTTTLPPRWAFQRRFIENSRREPIACGNCVVLSSSSCKRKPTRPRRCSSGTTRASSFSVFLCSCVPSLLSSPVLQNNSYFPPFLPQPGGRKAGPAGVFVVTEGTGGGEQSLLTSAGFLFFDSLFVSSSCSAICCGCSPWRYGKRCWGSAPAKSTPQWLWAIQSRGNSTSC